jgi:hypothetical protein
MGQIIIIVWITLTGMAVSFTLGYFHGRATATTKEDA